MKQSFYSLCLCLLTLSTSLLHAQFAESVVDYQAGSGVNARYTDPSVALGEPARTTRALGGGDEPVTPFVAPWLTTQVVSVGTGGRLTVRMKEPVRRNPSNPYGLDFIVFGNAFFVYQSDGSTTGGGVFGNSPGNTIVSVSVDGLIYYQLDPALAPVVDGLYPSDGVGDFLQAVDPTLESSDFSGEDEQGIRTLYDGSGGGTGFSLAWARDLSGEPIHLREINFIRVDVRQGKSEIDAFAAVAADVRTVVEDFSVDPLQTDWNVFGHSDCFRWNENNENLEVTWDSSLENSYFRLPLRTVLSRGDDFSVTLDLMLTDIEAGVTEEKSSTFEIAFGFQNARQAESPTFYRGTGQDSPNLAEFNFFPDTGFGPTVWPAIFSTNSVLNYNGPGDFEIFELPLNETMNIELAYVGATETIQLSIRTNGVLVGPVSTVPLSDRAVGIGEAFTDFRIDTFAIASYSDGGQDPTFAGSVLAHGVVDNCVVSFPASPIRYQNSGLVAGAWRTEFYSRTDWNYVLEATERFDQWNPVSEIVEGTGRFLTLEDDDTGGRAARFYRVKALKQP